MSRAELVEAILDCGHPLKLIEPSGVDWYTCRQCRSLQTIKYAVALD